MTAETHSQLANFIWSICNLLRGPYKRNEYRKVILPLTVLRRFDCLLAPTKEAVLAAHPKVEGKPETVVRSVLEKITGRPFYNLAKLDMGTLLNDPNQLALNLNGYITSFSPNVRSIMERFNFDQQIAKMADKNLLYKVVKEFAGMDLSPERVDNVQMGYVFEELIRIGAEQANEETAPLSEIIEVLNERFGTEFTDEDRLFFEQIKERACRDHQLIRTALANPLDKFKLGIRKLLEDLMIERMGENDKIVTRYMTEQDFQGTAFPILAEGIFEAVREREG